jgi:hypothetical protein
MVHVVYRNSVRTDFDVTQLQQGLGFERRSQFGREKAGSLRNISGAGKRGTKMRGERTVSVALEKSRLAAGAAPPIAAPRLFGLDVGDRSTMLSGLLLALV